MDTPFTMRGRLLCIALLAGLAALVFPAPSVVAQSSSSDRFLAEEAQAVYLANLERAAVGVPPLRWNRELTLAARAFSYDAVVNRPDGYCGHEDSIGRGPGERMAAYGYVNMTTWAENVLCGMATPASAIGAWMRSDGHRTAMLDPTLREIGLGYYEDPGTSRGYVTMDLGVDNGFAPVIIEHEAPQTSSADVALYIYNPEPNDTFGGMGPVQEMMISNSPHFDDGAVWEPYAADKRWQLEDGEGWRTVYVRLRDALGRAVVTSDTIYLGDEVPWETAALVNLTTTIESAVAFPQLPESDMPFAQFRLNWLADDTHASFKLVYGDGGQVADADALGGTVFRMNGDDFESMAVVRTYQFIKEVPLVAYLRMAVADTTAADALVDVTINGGGVTYGPLTIHAADFAAAGEYRTLALPFTFHADDANPFLEVWMRTEGTTDFFFDAVTFYTQDVAVATPLTWAVPEGYYRGQSIWMRHSDGAGGFGEPTEMTATDADAPMLVVTPAPSQYRFEVNGDVVSPASVAIRVTCDDCGDLTWDVNCDAGWVTMHEQDDQLILSVDAAALAPSEYSTTVQILVPDSPDIAPVALAVDVVVVEADPQDDPQRQDDPTIAPLLPEHLVYLPYTMRR